MVRQDENLTVLAKLIYGETYYVQVDDDEFLDYELIGEDSFGDIDFHETYHTRFMCFIHMAHLWYEKEETVKSIMKKINYQFNHGIAP